MNTNEFSTADLTPGQIMYLYTEIQREGWPENPSPKVAREAVADAIVDGMITPNSI